MAEVRTITDQFGTPINVGDMVCFVVNTNAGWRQTKNIAREKVNEIICGAETKDGVYWDWLITDKDRKVSPSRVVKCY